MIMVMMMMMIFLFSSTAPYVAFSAYLDHTLTNVGQHETIIFNQVVLNEAEAYDTNSGIFTCPQDGVYLFSFFIGKVLLLQFSPFNTLCLASL